MKDMNPKRVLLDTLRKQYRIESIRGSDIIALNSKAILYIRSNRNAGATRKLLGKFWFGITKSEYEKYSHQNFFIVCSCVLGPDVTDYLVFPSDKFEEIKKDIVLQSGQWKFNLLKTNDKRYLLQIGNRGKYDVTEFLNYFDFTPREFRRICAPKLGEFQPKEATIEEKPRIPEKLMPLEDELLTTAKDSANPKNLELALERFFTEIGFRCRRIGGPGETDILVSEPIKFIIDGKSTRTDAKSAISFTRIKRHKIENGGEFMVIVSVGFDPAVRRDAEIEGATLIDIQTLITILRIHREYVLSPFDYIEILRQPGMITSEKMSALQEKIGRQRDALNKSLALLENFDFNPRSLDEIKGRTDLYCEQNEIEKLDRKEIESIIDFLSHDLVKIVKKEGQRYLLLYTPLLAREKLKSMIRILCLNQNGRSPPTTL